VAKSADCLDFAAMTARLLACVLILGAAVATRADTPNAEAPLIIEDQPIARIVSVGGHVTLSITATGAPSLIYQWFKGTQPVGNNSRISGASTAVLNIDPVQTTDTSNYFAVVTSGTTSITSSPASMLVQDIPRAVTLVGTNVVVNALGPIGEVYRIEFFSFSTFTRTTNGYATNRTGVAEFVEPQRPGGGIYTPTFERMLPVLYPPSPTNIAPLLRAYGKLNQSWRFEATTNFVTWTNLATLTNTHGWVKFNDTNALPSGRFYRISPP
jgi:hypothetical protein